MVTLLLVGASIAIPARVTRAQVSPPPVSVAYADTHHPPSKGQFPSPWFGSPNIVFVGTTTNDWDAGTIKIDNTTGASLTVSVTVTIGSASYSLWGSSNTIPSGNSLILTQTDDVNL
ncbi:MAG TPA: hypothetical protein VK457_10265, partial [Chloroflexota bacterium]|nr:hypothetical protein [Chloroflexota bacterium]